MVTPVAKRSAAALHVMGSILKWNIIFCMADKFVYFSGYYDCKSFSNILNQHYIQTLHEQIFTLEPHFAIPNDIAQYFTTQQNWKQITFARTNTRFPCKFHENSSQTHFNTLIHTMHGIQYIQMCVCITRVCICIGGCQFDVKPGIYVCRGRGSIREGSRDSGT